MYCAGIVRNARWTFKFKYNLQTKKNCVTTVYHMNFANANVFYNRIIVRNDNNESKRS